ncbi:hypothetical protein ACKF11_13030 [Methylobacillus sp. Pita2]|uniref:hypothetical protein n=1 Tax=Methylobacillus sp. Pita2 TaxID=3383245 RepID=UPI0038B53B47
MSQQTTSSIAKLALIHSFKHGAKPEVVTVGNVDTPGVVLPEDCLVGYYGFSQSREEISDYKREADARKEYTNSVSVSVEIGETIGWVSPELLPQTRLLNLIRMTKSLEEQVVRVWKLAMKEHGIDEALVNADGKYWKKLNYIHKNTSLLGELRKHESFAHIDAIVFPYNNPKYELEGGSLRIALFSYDHVVAVESDTFPEIRVELPKLGQGHSHTPKM